MTTPQFIGQIWQDTDSGIIWQARTLDPGSWAVIGKALQVDWEPPEANLGAKVGFFNENPIYGITSASFKQKTTSEGFRLQQWMDTTQMSFPNLVTAHVNGMQIYSCPVLTTIDLPKFLPSNGGNVLFPANALTVAAVDHVLARCVASTEFVTGVVDMTGGTSAHPSRSGDINKNALIARGVTVNVN